MRRVEQVQGAMAKTGFTIQTPVWLLRIAITFRISFARRIPIRLTLDSRQLDNNNMFSTESQTMVQEMSLEIKVIELKCQLACLELGCSRQISNVWSLPIGGKC